MSISLFYFANCPLPFEVDPLLDTATALAYCEKIQAVFSKVVLSNVNGLSDLSRAVSHIHTCLTKRLKYIRTSCRGLPPDEAPAFYGTPFDIPKVVKVLDDLAKSSKVSILWYLCCAHNAFTSKETLRDRAPNLMSVPDC